MISFLANLLFVYKKCTNLSELILYPTLLKVFFRCRSLWVEFLRSFMYKSHANKENLTSFFPVDLLDLYYLAFINCPMTISSYELI